MRKMCCIQRVILVAFSIACATSAWAIEQPGDEFDVTSKNWMPQLETEYAVRPPYDPSMTLLRTGRIDRARDSVSRDQGYGRSDDYNMVQVYPRILEFLAPPAEVEIEAWQIFTLKFTTNGMPLAGKAGVVEVDGGKIQLFPFLGFVVTDAEGIARFMAKSDVENLSGATLKVTIDSEFTEHKIAFFAPNQDVSPQLGPFRMKSAHRELDLQIDPLRIGLLAGAKVKPATVIGWAAALLLTVERRLDGNFYIINTGLPLTQNSRWWLARELKKNGSLVRSAGLLAGHKEIKNPVVLDSRIYVRIEPSADIDAVLYGLLIDSIEQTEYGPNEFIVQSNHYDPLSFSMHLASKDPVIYAHPDVAQVIEQRSSSYECDYSAPSWEPWCDVRYKKQWHLENVGQGNALIDADADVRKAWGFSLGSKQTLIAVIDTSFFLEQPDLEPNLWEDSYSGIRGFDLVDNVHSSLLFEWEVDGNTFRHGTSVAGLAAARYGPNSEGGGGDVVGVCPDCMLLPIRVPLGEVTDDMKKAFLLASEHGADVVSMSLGFSLVPENITYDIDELVTNIGVTGKSSVLVFAMSNEERDNCLDAPDSSSLESVIAVGGVTDYDEKSYQIDEAMGYGDCIDLVAPTRGGEQDISTTNVITNDYGQPVAHIFDGFGGTSAATPQVAGTAALILDLVPLCQASTTSQESAPCLTPLQVRMILQDTADKVEQDKANYSPHSGFSDPPNQQTSTHGYGRLNAFEAVKLVAPAGSENKDLFVRDHEWDWGNTEQRSDVKFNILDGSVPAEREKISLLNSVDIKIDVGRDAGFDSSNELHAFTDLTHEDPEPGMPFDLYVRIRNRGQTTVSNAKLLVHWAVFEEQLPELDFEIWQESVALASDKTKWHTLGSGELTDLAYSGASVAGCFENEELPGCHEDTVSHIDRAEVYVFEVPGGIAWDASKEHLAFLAVVDSDEDHVLARRTSHPPNFVPKSALSQVVWDNNVALWVKKQPVEESYIASDNTTDDPGDDVCPENNGCGENCGDMPYWLCCVLVILLVIVVIAVALWAIKSRNAQ